MYASQILKPLVTSPYVVPMSTVQHLLLRLQYLLWQFEKYLHVSRIRGHSKLLGPLTQGNAMADSLS